jgi:flagellar biosynthesis GTPase FlhF
MAPLTVLTFGTGLQTGAPDSSVPTAIEQALIEHRCRTTIAAGAPGTDTDQECPGVQLLSLRTDFGRDLSRLSAAERGSIDSVCSTIRASQGRDAYVDCLSGQLVSLSNRRNRAKPDSSAAAPPAPQGIAPSASPASLPNPASSSSSGLWIGATLFTLGVAACGVFLAMKARRSPRKCRVCGMNVSDSGGLCQKCRHEAAETVKRAAAERADHQRAQEEERRQGSEHLETQRRLKSFEDEEARLRQQEQARQEEQARRAAETGQREEEARRQRQTDVTSDEVFDPCSILGVPRDATHEAIRAAYQEAKLKYDPDQVAHLGAELQEHFKAKAQAVEQAYQQLITK